MFENDSVRKSHKYVFLECLMDRVHFEVDFELFQKSSKIRGDI